MRILRYIYFIITLTTIAESDPIPNFDNRNSNYSNTRQLRNSAINNAPFELLTRYSPLASHAYCPMTGRLTDTKIGSGLSEACDTKFCKSNDHFKVLRVYQGKVTFIILKDTIEKQIILSFKGSSSGDEWNFNINYLLKDYKPFVIQDGLVDEKAIDYATDGYKFDKAHGGFLQAYKIFHENSIRFLLNLLNENANYQLIITGHSLGGALGQLAAIEMSLMGYDVMLVTLAAPKMASKGLAKWMDKRFTNDKTVFDLKFKGKIHKNAFYRITHVGDAIPLLPFKSQGFAHSGCEIAIDTLDLSVTAKDIKVKGAFNAKTEHSKILKKFKYLIDVYLKNPKYGFDQLLQFKYHRNYGVPMSCSYAKVESVSRNATEIFES